MNKLAKSPIVDSPYVIKKINSSQNSIDTKNKLSLNLDLIEKEPLKQTEMNKKQVKSTESFLSKGLLSGRLSIMKKKEQEKN